MIQLNVGDHQSPYAHLGWRAFSRARIETARWARQRAIAVAKGNPKANAYFLRLPKARTLAALLADRSIWINYAYALRGGLYGQAEQGGQELVISECAFRMGRWTVLATLIHELAHINGVPGKGHAAEESLLACGLGRLHEKQTGIDDPFTPYDPHIRG